MIEREFEGRVKRVGSDDVDIPVQVTLTYDEDEDPYAVQAAFWESGKPQSVWSFSRELLSAGVHSLIPLGRGDVKFRHFPLQGMLLVCLRAPARDGLPGHADIAFPHDEVVGFLDDTQALFDEATDDCTALIDGFLKEVLG